ncbi:MAG TPA: glycoside hydrolase family 66 protein [Pseudolysinimonas sp.]|jgi:dextranase
MTGVELLPTRSSFGPGDPVEVEVREAPVSGELIVRRLGDVVQRHPYEGADRVRLTGLPAGGYGVELVAPSGSVRTAIEVVADDRARLRYGFVVDYSPGRDIEGVSDLVRRLHLTDVQFYDWAYRHADLLGGGEEYRDALDQPISLGAVANLVAAVQAAGARALGYAAVYAVGPQEWPAWQHDALLQASGEPYGLGDFLFLVDPAAADWQRSFTGQLRESVERAGFDGFHLDQYGYPKRSARPDGQPVDVAASFVSLIGAVRSALPDAQLVFNNVNDFPTWATARTAQDAIYIEVWEPTTTLGALGAVVARARSVAAGKPVVIAAYQHVYDGAGAPESDLATAFTMATLFSHGATQLLAGESDRILVDPYYVRNHVVEASTAALLKRWYDFLVEHDRLLMAEDIVDVTASYAGSYNDDCDVSFATAASTSTAVPGTVWQRVTSVGDALVVHLINLTGQPDAEWDAPRSTPTPQSGILRFRLAGPSAPRVRAADPDAGGRLIELDVVVEGTHATVQLPEFGIWQVILIGELS